MKAWLDLRHRLLARARELGFDDLTSFSESNWDTDLVGLRERLGEPDVRPFQLDNCLRAEAIADGTVVRYVRGALLRELNYNLPQGWGPGDDSAARIAWVAAFETADFPYDKVTSPFPIEPRSTVPGYGAGSR